VRAQTLQAAEIVVIDDGSEDCTPQVVAAWGAHVRYQRVAHGGLPYARNRALRIAEFDVIAFVDSDDIWLPNKLELQMAALGQEAGPVMVFGYVQQFISSDLRSEEAARLKYNPTPLPGILSSTLLMRKSDCESVGSFDESMQTGEFIEWCSRAKDMGVKSVLIPDLVCRRRLHRNNIGRGGSETHRNYAHVIKKILDRRRQRG
jgi:glycosyltransferase involved in cell wall biosynthesis